MAKKDYNFFVPFVNIFKYFHPTDFPESLISYLIIAQDW